MIQGLHSNLNKTLEYESNTSFIQKQNRLNPQHFKVSPNPLKPIKTSATSYIKTQQGPDTLFSTINSGSDT